MTIEKDWHDDIPTTDAEWLDYADFWWPEIVSHNGLDTSFVGAYADADAISYARSFAGVPA